MSGNWRRNLLTNPSQPAHWYKNDFPMCHMAESGTMKVEMVTLPPDHLTAHGEPFGKVCSLCLRLARADRRGRLR